MNRICGLASKGYHLLGDTVKSAGKYIYDNDVVGRTTEVARGVFIGVVPHLSSISPLFLSRMVNMRVIGVSTLFTNFPQKLCEILATSQSKIKVASSIVEMAANIVGVVDFLGFVPPKLEYRLTTEGLLLLGTVIGSSGAIYKGTKQMISAWNAKESTTSKVAKFVSGTLLTTLGALGLTSAFNHGIRLVNMEANPETLKYRYFGKNEPKECKAIIINGRVDGDRFGDKIVFPFSEVLYEKCQTVAYDVRSAEGFCDAMNSAKDRLNGPIDVLSIQGHGSNFHMNLNGYSFHVQPEKLRCLNETLAHNAQIFLQGCNTATPTNVGSETLTEAVARFLPGKEVTGFSAYYNPALTTSSYSNGRFTHDSYCPRSLNGWVNPFYSSAVTIKS